MIILLVTEVEASLAIELTTIHTILSLMFGTYYWNLSLHYYHYGSTNQELNNNYSLA